MSVQSGALDRFVSGNSPVHQLDAGVKVVVTLLFVVSNVVLPDGAWLTFLLSWGLVTLASVWAGLGPFYAARRSFVALPFALAAVSAVFALPGAPIFKLQLGAWQLVATDAGLVRFASIVVRSWLSVQMAILLTATTRFPDLLVGLRRLRVPTLFIVVIGLMNRYLTVLTDEAVRLLRAREARSARPPGAPRVGGSIVWRAQVAGSMAGQLFLRSYERSDRVYQAMTARGYRGQIVTMRAPAMRRRDWAFGLAAGFVLFLLQLVARLAPR